MIAALLLQAAVAAAAPGRASAAAPERFSVLADPCARAVDEAGKDVVVCGHAPPQPRLPLPDERPPPDHGVPSNPEMTGTGALTAEAVPCSASLRGCTVGFGPPIDYVAAAKGAVHAVRSAFAKKPDRSGRVAIDLDAPPPTGRLLP